MSEFFKPLAVQTVIAGTAEAAANKFTVKYPSYVQGIMANIILGSGASEGTIYTTGYKQKITATTKGSTIEISGTDITAGDILNILIW